MSLLTFITMSWGLTLEFMDLPTSPFSMPAGPERSPLKIPVTYSPLWHLPSSPEWSQVLLTAHWPCHTLHLLLLSLCKSHRRAGATMVECVIFSRFSEWNPLASIPLRIPKLLTLHLSSCNAHIPFKCLVENQSWNHVVGQKYSVWLFHLRIH